MLVRLKKRDVTESRCGQNVSSRSSPRRLEQLLTKECGMRKEFILCIIHIISYYHRGKSEGRT